MARVNTLRWTSLPRDRRTRADAVAPDTLVESRAAQTRPQDRPYSRQPLCSARRAIDSIRGDAARRGLLAARQPGSGPQVGRAACRERVCQGGWITVVEGLLKKNT